jgi:phosphoadenosine phosphosulfate reductase
MSALTVPVETPQERISRLNELYRGATPKDIVRAALAEFGESLAAVSSFGSEAAITLHILSELAPATPVVFLETGMHFAQTLEYRDELIKRFGLSDVRNITPDPADRAAEDPKDSLWRSNPDACCGFRKVKPLDKALSGFSAWITGRKRMHGGDRLRLPVFEYDEPTQKFKVNPLASFGVEEVDSYFELHDLPRHALVAEGFPSIGCWPCTEPSDDNDQRAGRWAGRDKNECGIHLDRTAWSSLDSSEL